MRMHWFPRGLARDVAVVTAVKLAVIIAAAVFLFGPAQRPHVDADRVLARLTETNTVHHQLRTTTP